MLNLQTRFRNDAGLQQSAPILSSDYAGNLRRLNRLWRDFGEFLPIRKAPDAALRTAATLSE